MLFKLNSFNKFTTSLILLALLSACSASKVEKLSGNNIATFFVDHLEGNSEIAKVDSVYSLPTARLYNFKACIKDIMQSKAIQGQSFKILGGSKEITSNTDEQGCLNWSESIAYNFLAQPNYIQKKRTILAIGVHKGSTDIELALNPWSHGEDTSAVIDPTKKTISSLIVDDNRATSALISEGTSSPLVAINPKVIILEKEFSASGAVMTLNFQTKISLFLKNTAMQTIQYPINSGTFNVEMILYNSINENGNETLIPLANATKNGASFIQDTLIAEFPFQLNILPTKGQILMGIRISATTNELGLDPFESIYLVSDSSKINLSGMPTPVLNKTFSAIQNSLYPKSTNTDSTSKLILTKPGIEVDKLEIRFLKIGNENTTDRQVFFNIKACMKSNLDGRKIRDESFSIKTIASKSLINMKSNQDGCISWDDSVWHKYFEKEHFIHSVIVINNSNYIMNKQIEVLINPWDTSSNIGRDGRFIEELGSLKTNPSSESSKISFDNYSFAISKYDYEINKNLDLNLIKNGTLSLSAKVINPSSLSLGRMDHENLRDGQYLLKWAVITLDTNNKVDSVLNIGQKVISTFGGDIKTDLALKVTAFEKLNLRSRFVVALYTIKDGKSKSGFVEIDRNSGLEATPYFSTIILNNDSETQKMQKVQNNFGLTNADIFDQLNSIHLKNTKTFELNDKILADQNFKKINLVNEKETLSFRDSLSNPNKYYYQSLAPGYYHEAEQKPALDSATLINFAKTGKLSPDLASKFCSFWFNDFIRKLSTVKKNTPTSNYENMAATKTCLDAVRTNPNKFFNIDKKLIIKKVGNIKLLSGTTTNFNVGNSFSVAQSESSTKTQTMTWTNSLGLNLDFFSIFRVSSSASYAIASTKAKSDATTSAAQIVASTYLFMQTNTFNIEALSYEECSTIKLNSELFTGKNSSLGSLLNQSMTPQDISKIATSGFFICTGVNNNNPIIKKENYYLISQDFSKNSGEQDANAQENNQFFLTFRGQQDLMKFINLTQSSLKLSSNPESLSRNNMATEVSIKNSFSALPTLPGIYTDLTPL
jgi:hypothetical protein